MHKDTTKAALEAIAEGFTPIPLTSSKKPYTRGWQDIKWDSEDQSELIETFENAHKAGNTNIGLLLGAPSSGLIDVDIDHPIAERLSGLLPETEMVSGRKTRPGTHRWYMVDGDLPLTKAYTLHTGEVSLEIRSSGAQTLIPPSIHPEGDPYTWEYAPWGGEVGPSIVDGKELQAQVALIGLLSVLTHAWPDQGSRHSAYLALAGGLMRGRGDSLCPWWSKQAPGIIASVARFTGDEEGSNKRVSEAVQSTTTRLQSGKAAAGWPALMKVLPERAVTIAMEIQDHVTKVLDINRPQVTLSTLSATQVPSDSPVPDPFTKENEPEAAPPSDNGEEEEQLTPLELRKTSWSKVNISPYLSGQVRLPEASVMKRTDGVGLFYAGRLNLLYGKSESAKSWISLHACCQEMLAGRRAMYLDLEDEPVATLARFRALGMTDEILLSRLAYLRPESSLAPMMRGKFSAGPTPDSVVNHEDFVSTVLQFDPHLIVVDGMTMLYGMHGLDTNDAMSTDVITGWLKTLTRNSRTTVVVIDHTGKTGGAGASPIGAHHKIAMIQGTAFRADAVEKPMPGAHGKINLTVYKDRPGSVRAVSAMMGDEQVAGVVHIDSTQPHRTDMWIDPIEPGTILMDMTDSDPADPVGHSPYSDKDRVIQAFTDPDESLKFSEIATIINAPSHKTLRKTMKFLEGSGLIETIGQARSTRYVLTQDGAARWQEGGSGQL